MRTTIGRLERATGLFVVASLILLLGALVFGGARRFLETKPYTLRVAAPGAIGVAKGSTVRLHGVPVGQVTEIRIVPNPATEENPVEIMLEIEREPAKLLKRDAEATISAGMSPLVAAEILLTSKHGEPLPPDTLLVAHVRPSIVDALTGTATEVGEELKGILADAKQTVKNLNRITDELTLGRSMASKVLIDPALGTELDRTVAEAQGAVADVRGLLARADAAARHAPATAENVHALSEDARRLSGSLQQAVSDVRRILSSTERSLALVEELAKSLKTTASYAPELARKADTSLEETERLLDAAQKNILIRGSLDPKAAPRTEHRGRPPALPPPAAPAPSANGGSP